MTKKQLERVVREWQHRLGLGLWELRIDWDRQLENSDAWAEIKVHDTYDQATVRFESALLSQPDRLVTVTVIHELLHALHRDIDQSWKSAISALHPDANAQADARYYGAYEAFIDRVALRIYELGQ